MHRILNSLSTTSMSRVKVTIVLLSILIASQVQYIQQGWINPDSILYLEAAKLFALGEWGAGFEIFSWPFYSLWIAAVHVTTHLSLHHSAQLLNILFFAVAAYAFITIIQLCGGKQKEAIAGALIFLSAPYLVGSVLEMLMRDEGFWAFFLLGIMHFVRFYQQRNLSNALAWQIAIIFATLFRIESILYLMLLPLVLVFEKSFPRPLKIKLILQAHCIQVLIFLATITALTISDHFPASMLGRLNEILTPDLINDFTRLLLSKSQIMSEQVLGKFLNEFALPSLILTLTYITMIKIINATGLINVGLALFAMRKQSHQIESKSFKVLTSVSLIALLNMALIITKVFVLSGRYVLALSFILMIFASFSLAHLLQQFQNSTKWRLRILTGFIVLFMCLSLVKNLLPKKDGYNYMQNAIIWLKVHNAVNSPVYYNEARLRYFAGEPFIGKWDDDLAVLKDALDKNEIAKYSILAIAINDKQLNQNGLPDDRLKNYAEINRFSDAKKKKFVIIYKKQ